MQVVAGPASVKLAELIAERLQLKLVHPEYKLYPDGETYLRIPSHETDTEYLVVQSCYEPQDTNLFQLLNIVSTLKRLHNPKVVVYTPYLCYSRADRETLYGEAISLHTVLQLLDSVGTDRLIVLDIHNPDALEIDTRMVIENIFPLLSMKKYLENHLKSTENLEIIAPDEGSILRAQLLAQTMNLQYNNLTKTRNPVTGEIAMEISENHDFPEEVVMMDDILSTGSTLIQASNLIKLYGVKKIHYLVTHALNSNSLDRLQEMGNGLVAATNSIPTLMGTISTEDDVARVLNDEMVD